MICHAKFLCFHIAGYNDKVLGNKVHSWPSPAVQNTGSEVVDGAGFGPEISSLLSGALRDKGAQ